MKALKTQYGYVAKRKARIEHECSDCGCIIQPKTEYYQVSNDFGEFGDSYYLSKAVCEKCWNGISLDARNKASYQRQIDRGEAR